MQAQGLLSRKEGAFPPPRSRGWRRKHARDMIPHPVALQTMHRARTRPWPRASQPHRCNAPEQSQACDPMLTLSGLGAAGGQLFGIQNSRKVIMSKGGETEITTPLCRWAGVSQAGAGGGTGKSLQAPFSNWVVLWTSMPWSQKKRKKKKDTGSWKDVLKFLYLCQSPCPERAHAWRKLKTTALHSALLPIQANRNFEVNSQPLPVVGGFIFLTSQRHVRAGTAQSGPAGVESRDPTGTPPWPCRALGGFLGKRVPLARLALSRRWKRIPGNPPSSRGRLREAGLHMRFARG